MIRLGESRLTLDDLVDVARGDVRVELPAEARQRVRASRRVVDEAVRAGQVVYGVTTGFGRLKDQLIAPEDTRSLQVNLLRSHCAGVGPPAPREVVRAMLLLRAHSLAMGFSGVRPELVERMTLPVFATEFNVESLQANVELAAGQGLIKAFDVRTMVWKP